MEKVQTYNNSLFLVPTITFYYTNFALFPLHHWFTSFDSLITRHLFLSYTLLVFIYTFQLCLCVCACVCFWCLFLKLNWTGVSDRRSLFSHKTSAMEVRNTDLWTDFPWKLLSMTLNYCMLGRQWCQNHWLTLHSCQSAYLSQVIGPKTDLSSSAFWIVKVLNSVIHADTSLTLVSSVICS